MDANTDEPRYAMYKLPTGDCIVVPFFESLGANTIQHFTSEGLVIARRVVITPTGWHYADAGADKAAKS